MLDRNISSFGILKPDNIHGNEFTGYEPDPEFDKFTNETYNADLKVQLMLYLIYTPVSTLYHHYTEQGLVDAIKTFRNSSYNNVKDGRIGLGNNRGQTINRSIFQT